MTSECDDRIEDMTRALPNCLGSTGMRIMHDCVVIHRGENLVTRPALRRLRRPGQIE